MRPCCARYEKLREHLRALTPAEPTSDQKIAAEALAEMIERADDQHKDDR